MAYFHIAYSNTKYNEAGYVNDPDDNGGETYNGISRVYNPQWSGWPAIDRAKNDKLLNKSLLQLIDEYLDPKAEPNFYIKKYWNVVWGDKITDQNIANELFDTGVNMHPSRAIEFLQSGLNLLNRNEKNYPDIVEDGIMGNNTLSALRSYLSQNHANGLLKIMNTLQNMHYINYMRKYPKQEKYARGWLNR